MSKNKNLANSAKTVFIILQKLIFSQPTKEDLLDGFSVDSLEIYLNTLRKLGLIIKSPTKNNKTYQLIGNFDFLNFDDEEFEMLIKIKKILAKKSSYSEVMTFNSLLCKLMKFVDKKSAQKLYDIVGLKPFGVEFHEKILALESLINDKKTILLTYNSPNSNKNYFKVLPQKIKLQNNKLYFCCYDFSLKEVRNLLVERILEFKFIDEEVEHIAFGDYVLCEFSDVNEILLQNDEKAKIIEKKQGKILVEFYLDNQFELFQKLLSFGKNCRIIEPYDFKMQFKQKLKFIKESYGK